MEVIEEVGTDLIVVPKTSIESLFVPNGMQEIIDRIRAEVAKYPPDISTEDGRKQIASLARKVASSKVKLDDLGKSLVSKIKLQSAAIDAERKRMRDDLDQLKDDTRRPLTDWENAEEARLVEHELRLKEIADLAAVPFGASLEEIKARMDELEGYPLRDWQEFAMRSKAGVEAARIQLQRLYDQTKKAEEDRRELERLQTEEAKRKQERRDAELQAEAAEKARREAEAKAKALAEAEELRQAEVAARAKQEAEKRIQDAERAKKEQEENTRRAEAATVQAKKDAELATQRERERVAEEKRKTDAETARREADTKHKASINRAALSALVKIGLDEKTAKLVVTAISQGKIPAVRISY